MNLQFTPNGSVITTTLGDDPSKYGVIVEQVGGECLVQSENLAGAANRSLFPRGNVGGQFVFRSKKSYTDLATTWITFRTHYGLLNSQGTIVQTQDTAILTYANAILRNVQRMPASGDVGGTLMEIRYTFEITTIS